SSALLVVERLAALNGAQAHSHGLLKPVISLQDQEHAEKMDHGPDWQATQRDLVNVGLCPKPVPNDLRSPKPSFDALKLPFLVEHGDLRQLSPIIMTIDGKFCKSSKGWRPAHDQAVFRASAAAFKSASDSRLEGCGMMGWAAGWAAALLAFFASIPASVAL